MTDEKIEKKTPDRNALLKRLRAGAAGLIAQLETANRLALGEIRAAERANSIPNFERILDDLKIQLGAARDALVYASAAGHWLKKSQAPNSSVGDLANCEHRLDELDEQRSYIDELRKNCRQRAVIIDANDRAGGGL